MFCVKTVRKDFGDRIVLRDLSFVLSRTSRVGLIGANGSGKSTLLRILAGELEPDSGQIETRGAMRVAYVPQRMDVAEDTAIGAFLDGALWCAYESMQRIEQMMSAALEVEDLEKSDPAGNLMRRYIGELEAFDTAGGYEAIAILESKLKQIGLNPDKICESTQSISGGQQTKLLLTKALCANPDLLLLDEPTNNLDIDTLLWLENVLADTDAGIIAASHDRRFLDKLASRIFELDSATGTLTEYGGNYSEYCRTKQANAQRQWREYNEQQKRIHKLQSDIRATKEQALATELTTVDDFLRGRSKKVAAKAKAREHRLTRMLSQEHRREKPVAQERIRINFTTTNMHNRLVFHAQDLTVQRGEQAVLTDVNLYVKGNARIAIQGTNGSGKSTLLEAFTGRILPSSGSLTCNEFPRIAYMPQMPQRLDSSVSVLQHFLDTIEESLSVLPENQRLLDEGAARTFLNRFLFTREHVFTAVSALSKGEQSKLQFACFMALQPDVLLLDEPTNHLDLPSIERLEEALQSFTGALLVVSHDREFIENIHVDTILLVKDSHLEVHPVPFSAESPRSSSSMLEL